MANFNILFSYIDSGSGSFMIQLLAASAFYIIFTFKKYIGTFFSFLLKPFRKKRSLIKKDSVNLNND